MRSNFFVFSIFIFLFIFSNPSMPHAYSTESGIDENDIVDIDYEISQQSTGQILQPRTRILFDMALDHYFVDGKKIYNYMFSRELLYVRIGSNKTILEVQYNITSENNFVGPETYIDTIIHRVHVYGIVDRTTHIIDDEVIDNDEMSTLIQIETIESLSSPFPFSILIISSIFLISLFGYIYINKGITKNATITKHQRDHVKQSRDTRSIDRRIRDWNKQFIFCLACGMDNPKDSNYCMTCGIKL